MDKKERLKSIIKGKVQSRPTFGTDPNDPWSTKAGINEDETLNKYFISKGLNPKTASKVSKISASKTGEFEKWKQRRVRGGRLPEEVESVNEDELLNKYLISKGLNPKTASKISKIAASKTGEFERWKQRQVRGGRLPEEIELDENHMGDMPSSVKGSEHVTHRRKQELDHRKHKHSIIPVAGPGLRKEEHDAESLAKKHGVAVSDIEKQLKMGQDIEHEHTKDDAKALKIAKDHVAEMPDYYSKLKKMEQGKCNESYSKSAQMIKDLYRKKIKEDLNDWEKEDKSVQTYGKKPNHDKADKKDSMGEKKPQASAVLSGGKTLTGEPRDTIEIDPMMRVRPGQPDPTKDKDKKDDKKQENKKDK